MAPGREAHLAGREGWHLDEDGQAHWHKARTHAISIWQAGTWAGTGAIGETGIVCYAMLGPVLSTCHGRA